MLGETNGPGQVDYEVEGPSENSRAVYAWANRSIPFQHLSDSAQTLRAELRGRIARLTAGSDELLSATYIGTKDPRADIENILLYNIDMDGGCFQRSTRRGVRFQLATGSTHHAASDRRWPCLYEYRVVPADSLFEHWIPTRQLARFEGLGLGSVTGRLPREQV